MLRDAGADYFFFVSSEAGLRGPEAHTKAMESSITRSAERRLRRHMQIGAIYPHFEFMGMARRYWRRAACRGSAMTVGADDHVAGPNPAPGGLQRLDILQHRVRAFVLFAAMSAVTERLNSALVQSCRSARRCWPPSRQLHWMCSAAGGCAWALGWAGASMNINPKMPFHERGARGGTNRADAPPLARGACLFQGALGCPRYGHQSPPAREDHPALVRQTIRPVIRRVARIGDG